MQQTREWLLMIPKRVARIAYCNLRVDGQRAGRLGKTRGAVVVATRHFPSQRKGAANLVADGVGGRTSCHSRTWAAFARGRTGPKPVLCCIKFPCTFWTIHTQELPPQERTRLALQLSKASVKMQTCPDSNTPQQTIASPSGRTEPFWYNNSSIKARPLAQPASSPSAALGTGEDLHVRLPMAENPFSSLPIPIPILQASMYVAYPRRLELTKPLGRDHKAKCYLP